MGVAELAGVGEVSGVAVGMGESVGVGEPCGVVVGVNTAVGVGVVSVITGVGEGRISVPVEVGDGSINVPVEVGDGISGVIVRVGSTGVSEGGGLVLVGPGRLVGSDGPTVAVKRGKSVDDGEPGSSTGPIKSFGAGEGAGVLVEVNRWVGVDVAAAVNIGVLVQTGVAVAVDAGVTPSVTIGIICTMTCTPTSVPSPWTRACISTITPTSGTPCTTVSSVI